MLINIKNLLKKVKYKKISKLDLFTNFLFILFFLGLLYSIFTVFKLFKEEYFIFSTGITPATTDQIAVLLKNECYSKNIKRISNNGILINNFTLDSIKNYCDQKEIEKKSYDNQKHILKGDSK